MIISSMFVCVMDMFNVRVRTVSDLEKNYRCASFSKIATNNRKEKM